MNRIYCFLFLAVVFLNTKSNAQDSVQVNTSVKLLPVLWQQQSAEYRALCYQAFNMARWRIDEMKLRKRHRYAIITDVDETLVDNSYYEARQIKAGKGFDQATWKQWTDESSATAVPGAVDFLRYAHSKGVRIFYISNRDTSEVESTMKNLKRLEFPDVERTHLMFRATSSAKEPRRAFVADNYKVIMLLGDNLNDFLTVFERKSNEERADEADKMKDVWGNRFIVLPNAVYGEWENALYEYKRLPENEKPQRLRKSLVVSPSN